MSLRRESIGAVGRLRYPRFVLLFYGAVCHEQLGPSTHRSRSQQVLCMWGHRCPSVFPHTNYLLGCFHPSYLLHLQQRQCHLLVWIYLAPSQSLLLVVDVDEEDLIECPEHIESSRLLID